MTSRQDIMSLGDDRNGRFLRGNRWWPALGKMQRLSALSRRSEPAKSWTRRACSKMFYAPPPRRRSARSARVLLLQLGRFAEAEAYLKPSLKGAAQMLQGGNS
jgi:hypothetical protein